MVEDDDTHDWAVDCDGEGQEWVVRDGGDSGVVMIATGGGRWWRQNTTAKANNDSGGRQKACKIGRRTTKRKDKSGWQQTVETEWQ